MKKVYYTCPFVPAELIAACGLEPRRSVPSLRADLRIEGMCSFAAAWLESLGQSADAGEDFVAIFSTACDQMRRAFDLFNMRLGQRGFLLNVPSTITENSLQYYVRELRRLEKYLCSISGRAPDWSSTSKLQVKKRDETARTSKRLAITGGPLDSVGYRSMECLLNKHRADIVFDGTEGAAMPELSGFDAVVEDTLETMARAYFEMPAIWRRPNDAYYRWMLQNVERTGADAALLVRHVFCDLWHGQGQELSRRLALPVLELDLDGRNALPLSAVSRIEAFLEAMG